MQLRKCVNVFIVVLIILTLKVIKNNSKFQKKLYGGVVFLSSLRNFSNDFFYKISEELILKVVLCQLIKLINTSI